MKWTVYSKEKPRKVGSYLVTHIADGRNYVDYDYWTVLEKFKYHPIDVVAWMPFPEPYEAEQTEPQTIRCPKCGRTDYIRSFEKDFGIKDSVYKYKCINCNTYIKDEPQTQLTAKCLECNNSKACKENHWEDCRYEPLGYEVTAVVGTMKTEPQTDCPWK